MRTKTIKLIMLLMAILPSFSQQNAKSPNRGDDDLQPIVLKGTSTRPPRSIEDLECYYLNGYVYIIGDASVTSISGTVTRIGDNMQWSDSSTSNTLQIAVSTDAGSYHLTFTLSDGSSYYGDYTLTL